MEGQLLDLANFGGVITDAETLSRQLKRRDRIYENVRIAANGVRQSYTIDRKSQLLQGKTDCSNELAATKPAPGDKLSKNPTRVLSDICVFAKPNPIGIVQNVVNQKHSVSATFGSLLGVEMYESDLSTH